LAGNPAAGAVTAGKRTSASFFLGGGVPERTCLFWSPITGWPLVGSKRTMSVISFCMPPAKSQGSQTL
jgi:hypothetical protein